MALDPSIALQTNSNPGGNVLAGVSGAAQLIGTLQDVQNKKAQLPLIKAQTENAQAQTPGLVADSAIKARAAAFQNWQSQNAGQFVSTPQNPDGTEATGAPPIIDHNGFAAAAAKAGFYTEAQGVMAADLKNQADQLKNGSDSQTLAVTTRGNIATLMQAYQHNNPQATQDQLDTEYNSNIKGAADQVGKAVPITSILGQPQNSDGTYSYDPHFNNALVQATMTPQVQADLKLRQGSLAVAQEANAQAGEVSQSGAKYRDPNSPQTAAARQAAIAAGLDPALAGQMTAAQLSNNPAAGGIVKEALVPGSSKVQAAAQAGQEAIAARTYTNAANKLTTLATTVDPQTGQPIGKDPQYLSSPAQWLKNNLARFAGGPQAAVVADAQAAYGNANTNPELGFDKLGAGALAQAMTSQAQLHGQNADQFSSQARGTSFSSTAPNATPNPSSGKTPSGTQVAPTATPKVTGTVKVTSPDGKTGSVPAARLQEYLKNGFKQVQ